MKCNHKTIPFVGREKRKSRKPRFLPEELILQLKIRSYKHQPIGVAFNATPEIAG